MNISFNEIETFETEKVEMPLLLTLDTTFLLTSWTLVVCLVSICYGILESEVLIKVKCVNKIALPKMGVTDP